MTMRIHEYSGKEKGLMIIGSASDIKYLGQCLIDSCNDMPESEKTEWPRTLHNLEIRNAPGYSLSFHLETTMGDKPKGNGFQSEKSKTVFLILAVIGFISIIRWAIKLVL